jgi:hypothetical protein
MILTLFNFKKLSFFLFGGIINFFLWFIQVFDDETFFLVQYIMKLFFGTNMTMKIYNGDFVHFFFHIMILYIFVLCLR